MGLHQLMTYCLKNRKEIEVIVDLVEEAKKRNGIKLIVDMMTFDYTLRGWLTEYIASLTGNDYLMIIAEEMSTLDKYVTSFIKKLSAVDISLIWLIDAEKAGSLQHLETKIPRLKQHHMYYMKRVEVLMKVCDGIESLPTVDEGGCSLLSSVQLERTVRRLAPRYGGEVIQCPHPDGDLIMVQRLLSDDKVFALLSNDSDFMIFEGGKFMPTELFDRDNSLHLKESSLTDESDETIKSLVVGLFSTQKLSQHLQFADQKMVTELSILKGNGFTNDFIFRSKLLSKLRVSFKPPTVFTDIARLLRENGGRVDNIPLVKRFMVENPVFRMAVEGARNFYNTSRVPLRVDIHTPHAYFIQTRIEEDSLPPDAMCIYHGFYWRILLVEEHMDKWPCVEAALTPLRRYIYRMILPAPRNIIQEFGRGCQQQFEVVPVDLSDVKVVALDELDEENRPQNLNHFHYIMTHMERDDAAKLSALRKPKYDISLNPAFAFDDDDEEDDESTYFDYTHGDEKKAFIMYLLRYMLVLNWRQNLSISDQQFLALTAVLLRRSDDCRYQTLCRLPTPRAVTIANWFLDIYRHAYSFVARSLYVAENFPEPKDIFCGSTWIAYSLCCGETDTLSDDLEQAREEIRDILLINQELVEKVTRGYFSFNPENPLMEDIAIEPSLVF